MKANYASIIEFETNQLVESKDPFVFDKIPFMEAMFYIDRYINILEDIENKKEELRNKKKGTIINGT
mgnify:CR=1 FL=1